jgi:hypothetical protein
VEGPGFNHQYLKKEKRRKRKYCGSVATCRSTTEFASLLPCSCIIACATMPAYFFLFFFFFFWRGAVLEFEPMLAGALVLEPYSQPLLGFVIFQAVSYVFAGVGLYLPNYSLPHS